MKKVIIFSFGICFLMLNGSFKIVQNKEFDLTITIKGIKKIEGDILIAVHNSAKTFLNERYKSAKVKVTSKTMTATISGVAKGSYGVAIFQDINSNGELDTNMMGIPQEPYGFSNDAKAVFSAPSFDKAKFTVDADTEITINI